MRKEPEWSQQLQARICDLIMAGNYRQTAARLCGIARGQLSRWVEAGQAGIEPYGTFVEALEISEATFVNWALEQLRETKGKDWTRWAWLLERKYPEMWGRRDRTPLDVLKEEARKEALKQGVDPGDVEKELERLWAARN